MRSKQNLEELLDLLPKELPYTVASSGTYIYSGINIPISFELFISEEIGLKYPVGNLQNEKINAISSLLDNIKIGKFKHRIYGNNKTDWSIWELSLEGVVSSEIPNLMKELVRVQL